LRRLEPRVPGDDAILAVDQDRVREAKGLDAAGDQGNLIRRVGPGIRRVGHQRRDRAHHDFFYEVHLGRLFYSVK
jgi:hypothetical protein